MTTPNAQAHRDARYQAPQMNMENLYAPVMVTVTVNDSDQFPHEFVQREFTVPRELICRHSEFFRGAFEGRFSEAGVKAVAITDIHPNIFSTFIDYLYLGEISQDDDIATEWGWCYLFDCYIFADKYITPLFQHLITEAIQTRLMMRQPTDYNFPKPADLCIVFKHTPTNSPLRQILVDAYVTEYALHESNDDHVKRLTDSPPEFVALCLDFSMRWSELQACQNCGPQGDGKPCTNNENKHAGMTSGDFCATRWCQYHRHANEKEGETCLQRRNAVIWKFADPRHSSN